MEDAAIYAQASWFQATARQRDRGPLGSEQLYGVLWDLRSVSRVRIFICSTCLRLSTTEWSSAAASWTERMSSSLPRKVNSWAAPLPKSAAPK